MPDQVDPTIALQQGTSLQETPEERAAKAAQKESEGLILGKYKSQEDLIAAYKALEGKLSEQGNEVRTLKESMERLAAEKVHKPEEATAKDPISTALAIAEKALAEKLTEIPADLKGTTGLPPEVEEKLVQQQMDMLSAQSALKAQQEQIITQNMISVVGSAEQLQAIDAYLEAHYDAKSREQIEAAARNPTTMTLTLRGLLAEVGNAKDTQKNSKSGPISGDRAMPAEASGFASREDYQAALGDKRYSTDPEYRSNVDARLRRSKWVGQGLRF